MGIFLHLLLTGFLLAGFRVYEISYDQTHTVPLENIRLQLTENEAELTILSQTLTIPLGASQPAVRSVSYALMNGPVRFWYSLIGTFTDSL